MFPSGEDNNPFLEENAKMGSELELCIDGRETTSWSVEGSSLEVSEARGPLNLYFFFQVSGITVYNTMQQSTIIAENVNEWELKISD